MKYEHYRDVAEYFRIGRTESRGHFHRAIEIVYCINHEKPVIIDGKEMLLKEGELLFVPPFSTHIFPRVEEQRSLCVVLPLSYTDIFEKQTNGMQFESPIFCDKSLTADIYEMLLKLQTTKNPLICSGIYNYTVGKLLENGTLVESEKRQSDIFAIKVLTYLELHYSEETSLESAAFALGYSRCYFSTIFKKIFHKGFCEYLSMLRVKKSLRMLEENCPISNVAYAVGFGSMQSYYTNFKKVMGNTPAAYLSQKKTGS